MRNEANFNGFCLSGRLICLTGHRGFVGMSESSLRTAAQMSKSFHDSRDMTTAAQADDAQSLWNSTNRNKTNYDPCPAGYCVPVQNGYAWYSVFTASAMTWQTDGAIYTDPASVSTFYPAGGYLNGGTLTDNGVTVRNWAANLSATPSSTAYMHAYSLMITLSSQTVKINEAARSAFGLPVRCMKI